MCWDGERRREGRSANLVVVRIAFTPFLVEIEGLASMEWSPLLRERTESVELSEYIAAREIGARLRKESQSTRACLNESYTPDQCSVVRKPRGKQATLKSQGLCQIRLERVE